MTCFAQSVGGNVNAIESLKESDKTKIIQQLKRAMSSKYVFPRVAQQVNKMLDLNLKKGAYAVIKSRSELAKTLTEQLHSETKDKHLAVRFEDPLQLASYSDELGVEHLEKIELVEEFANNPNLGLKQIGLLAGKIGYIDLRVFGLTQFAAPAIADAMQSLSKSDALIIDLRKNHGGSPDTVIFLASYFVPPNSHLGDIYDRVTNRTIQHRSLLLTPTPAYDSRKKVYLLSSKETFSAAEDFAYMLQSLQRSTLIGEVTGGGAHPTMKVRLLNDLVAFIPFARSINPITKTNWEGVGVRPEIEVEQSHAFEKAYLKALNDLGEH